MSDDTTPESLANALTPWTPPRPLEHIESSKVDALRGNTFGITSSDAPPIEKLLRLVALVPMALQVADEARATVERQNEEIERLREQSKRLISQQKMRRIG